MKKIIENISQSVEIKFYDSLKNAFDLFQKSKKILITTHINPDGDAIGSSLAIYFYALSKEKHVEILISDNLPENLEFLDGSEKIKKFAYNIQNDYDLIFILDLNESSRLGSLESFVINSKSQKILFDHHRNPTLNANIVVSIPDASSTGEIVWDFLSFDKKHKINKEIASALYTAIMTDTGSFRFSSTSPRLLRIAAALIELGALPSQIYDYYFNNLTYRKMKLYGYALSSIESYYNGKLLIMTLRKEDFILTGANEDDVENFVENLLSIKGAKIGILLTDLPGKYEIRISFRAKDSYEVRSLALEFGGGGHYQASGARVKDVVLNDVKKDIILKASKIFL